MRGRRLALAITLVAGLLAVVQAASATADGVSYTFNLLGPNTAMAPSGPFAGDTIRVTGSGVFNTSGTVTADGSFTHLRPDGTVFARGAWQATAFVSFTPYGGPSPGFQGGELAILVTLFPAGGAPVSGVPMTVLCDVGSPPPGVHEGTTVDGFTHKTGGLTLFHLA